MPDLLTRADAVISDCGRYRYRLSREWGDGPTCLFIMLNPSTADALEDDPTIRRCIGFAKREGCGRLEVVNLYSFRATDPAELARSPSPNGPYAVDHIVAAVKEADGPVICGWGADPMARDQARYMLDMIRAAGKTPHCLGVTKNGAPRHPLYVKGDEPLVQFS